MATQQADEARVRLEAAYLDCGNVIFSGAEYALIKTFIDYKGFDAIPVEGDIAVSELASKIGGTEEIIERFTTFFLTGKVLASPGPGRVAHTARSLGYRSNEPAAALYVHMFSCLRAFAIMPEFFKENGLASPPSNSVTPFGYSYGFKNKPLYELQVEKREEHKGFVEALKSLGSMYSLNGVYDFGWMQESLTTGSRPAIVDVGGSHGLALVDALQHNQFIPAERCVLFDLPTVIENTKKTVEKNQDEYLQKVQMIPGSMFEPFPESIKAANIYIIRRVFNDFPDASVVQALKNIRETAAAPDTRILIIEEMLNPKRIPSNVCMDICLMMAAGKRRNAAMYSKLAEQAGFRLNAEFSNVNGKFDDFGVLEFVLAE